MSERQLVVFKLKNEEYGIEITKVEEIVRYQEITNIPQSTEYILGVINLRGRVIPIVDLKEKFYKMPTEITEETRIVVLNLEKMSVGIIVDSVSEVLRIQEENIEVTPQMCKDREGQAIIGVGKLEDRLLMLLDIDKTMTMEEKETLAEVK